VSVCVAALPQASLGAAQKIVDAYPGVMEPLVHAHFYLASFEFFKAANLFAEYFRNALLYLTYIDPNALSLDVSVCVCV